MSIKQRLAKRVNQPRNRSFESGDSCCGFNAVVLPITAGKHRGRSIEVGKNYSGNFYSVMS